MTASNAAANPLMTKLDGPSPAVEVARDMAKRSLWVLPAVLILCAMGWGINGAISGAYALAIVTVNFLLAAWLLGAAARISLAMMAGAAFFGFLLRLGLMTVAVLAVRDASWMEIVPLCITLIVTHLGLLLWELRYVSASLAYPGLKPTRP